MYYVRSGVVYLTVLYDHPNLVSLLSAILLSLQLVTFSMIAFLFACTICVTLLCEFISTSKVNDHRKHFLT